jgi:hypothetical protein
VKISKPTIDRDNAWEDIDLLARTGLDTPEEMLDILAEDVVARRDLTGNERARVAAEIGRDRLDGVLRTLEREHGFVAFDDTGCTASHSWSDVEVAWMAQGGLGSSRRAFAFYHRQEVERAVETGRLSFAAVLAPNRAAQAEACRILADALARAGFRIAWSGDPGTRVAMRDFVWQTRGPA